MVRKLKHTDIGDIPVDWELQTFDETFRVLSNNTLSRENLNNRGGAVRNIHYGDILTKFPEVLNCKEEIPYVNELSLLSSSTQLLQDGDIVIADTAEDETVGKVTEVQNLGDSKLVAGLHTIPCRVKKGDFAPGWLGYYMNSNLFHNQILPYITGIKVSSISKGAISETLILVPPFDEQEKIVQSLNEVQLLMTAETKVVNKMKFVKNGCLSKMFPQKDATVPEMRLPGFTEAWEQRKVTDLGEIYIGLVTTMTEHYTDQGHLLIRNSDIKDGFFEFGENPIYLDEEFSEQNKSRMHQLGDVITVHTGDIGTSAVIGDNEVNSIGFATIVTRPNQEVLDSDYFATYLNTDTHKQWAISMATGDGRSNYNLKDYTKLVVPIPQIKEQKKIAACIGNLNNLITLHQCKCDKYSNIKKGMMSDLLTGKIRLV
ncbi:restriction endonuclease subunit S [Eubacterium ventriosum]|uniref:restriction endonuclease subunit S n=1 Tax=Eubacterium ventriosum TaxID=39496 RepID=UPI0035225388